MVDTCSIIPSYIPKYLHKILRVSQTNIFSNYRKVNTGRSICIFNKSSLSCIIIKDEHIPVIVQTIQG